MNVGIVGSGEIADALATLAKAAGSKVRRERELLDWADVLLLAVPAEDVRATVRSLDPGPSARVVLATRGLEPRTGHRLSQVVVEESACLRVGALAGPILPGEIKRRSPCAAVVASAFREVGETTWMVLHSPFCRVYTSKVSVKETQRA